MIAAYFIYIYIYIYAYTNIFICRIDYKRLNYEILRICMKIMFTKKKKYDDWLLNLYIYIYIFHRIYRIYIIINIIHVFFSTQISVSINHYHYLIIIK